MKTGWWLWGEGGGVHRVGEDILGDVTQMRIVKHAWRIKKYLCFLLAYIFIFLNFHLPGLGNARQNNINSDNNNNTTTIYALLWSFMCVFPFFFSISHVFSCSTKVIHRPHWKMTLTQTNRIMYFIYYISISICVCVVFIKNTYFDPICHQQQSNRDRPREIIWFEHFFVFCG